MKFPINISKSIREAGKSSGSEKFIALFAFGGIIDFFVYIQLQSFTGWTGLGAVLLLLIILFLSVVIVVQIIRKFVIREDDKFIEHDKAVDATLADYYYISEKENNEVIENATIFEYRDGNFMFILRFTYGYTSDDRSESTRRLFMFIYNEVIKREMEIRTLNTPERFRESIECSRFLNGLSQIEEKGVSDVMMNITTNLLDICDSYNQCMSTVMIIRTKNPYQIQNIPSLIRVIVDEYRKHVCSLRGIEFLDVMKNRMFLTHYYGLEALDLTNLKLVDVDQETLLNYKNLVKVHKVEMDSGEVKELYDIELKTGSVNLK